MSDYFADVEWMGTNVIRLRFGRRTSKTHILSMREVHALWTDDASFSHLFSQALTDAPFDAFFWETPPLRLETFDAPFECVVTDAPSLAGQQSNSHAFAAKLANASADAIAFSNLSGDATLVVPVDCDETTDYCHLASFLRTAQSYQMQATWSLVAETVGSRLSRRETVWVSTSGLGVPWLHVRVEASPKYYSHMPYRVVHV